MKPQWIVVCFDGKRDLVYGKRGRRELGPPKPVMTMALPWSDVERQIEAAGYKVVPR